MVRRRKLRAGRAHDKVHRRYHKAVNRQVYHPKKPSWLDDWRFIWSDRTRRGAKRSWVQKLFRW